MINNKVIQFLSKVNFFLYVSIFFLLMVILCFLLWIISPENVPNTPNDAIEFSNSWVGFVTIVLIAPAFETILFQMIPILTTKEMVSKESHSFILSTFASALVFSFAHGLTYGKNYLFYSFIMGFVLAVSFFLATYRKEYPFFSVFVIHALWNFSVLLIIQIQ
jgi:hypothetical protein